MAEEPPLASCPTFPLEIWDKIIHFTLTHEESFLGPPTDLTSLSLVARAIYHGLLRFETHSVVYARLFLFKFDSVAVMRRLGCAWTDSRCLAIEFRKRIEVMKRFKHGRQQTLEAIHHEDLWTAYLMMLENDGRNERQLILWAELYHYLHYISHLRIDKRNFFSPRHWFRDTELTGLTLWLFWFMLSPGELQEESEVVTQRFMTKMLPLLIFQGYLFPSMNAPDSIFYLPSCTETRREIFGCSGPAPAVRVIQHYSRRLEVAAPLITPVALLLWNTRQQVLRDREPFDASSFQGPLTRAAANAAGLVGPTLEDIVDHYMVRTPAPEKCPLVMETDYELQNRADRVWEAEQKRYADPTMLGYGSRRYEHDWYRVVSLSAPFSHASEYFRGPVYSVGSFSGVTFAGSMVMPDFSMYNQAVEGGGQLFPLWNTPLRSHPLYFEMKEHHCLSPNTPLEATDDILNAWMPVGTKIRHVTDGIEVYDPTKRWTVKYDTHLPSGPGQCAYSPCATKMLQESGLLDQVFSHEYEPEGWIEDEDPGFMDITERLPKRGHADDDHDDHGITIGGVGGRSGMQVDGEGGVNDDLDDDVDDDDDIDYVEHKSSGVVDILLTGSSGERHGQAWGMYDYVGRVRPWDGLVVLVRTPRYFQPGAREEGRWIFKGHMWNGTFVGRWRETTTPANCVGFEGGFVMSRA